MESFFLIVLINKWFNIWCSFRIVSICSTFNTAAIEYWKHLSSLFLGFFNAFLFLKHFGESVYDLPRFRLLLWRLQYNRSILSKTSSLPFTGSSNSSWYFCNKDSKSSSIISCFITYHNFHIITSCIHSMSFIWIFRRN